MLKGVEMTCEHGYADQYASKHCPICRGCISEVKDIPVMVTSAYQAAQQQWKHYCLRMGIKHGESETEMNTKKIMTITTTKTIHQSFDCTISELANMQPMAEADIQVHIPGGGDYSNMSIDGDDLKCTVSWETTEVLEEHDNFSE